MVGGQVESNTNSLSEVCVAVSVCAEVTRAGYN